MLTDALLTTQSLAMQQFCSAIPAILGRCSVAIALFRFEVHFEGRTTSDGFCDISTELCGFKKRA